MDGGSVIAAAQQLSWPDAVVLVAFFMLVGVIVWSALR